MAPAVPSSPSPTPLSLVKFNLLNYLLQENGENGENGLDAQRPAEMEQEEGKGSAPVTLVSGNLCVTFQPVGMKWSHATKKHVTLVSNNQQTNTVKFDVFSLISVDD